VLPKAQFTVTILSPSQAFNPRDLTAPSDLNIANNFIKRITTTFEGKALKK